MKRACLLLIVLVLFCTPVLAQWSRGAWGTGGSTVDLSAVDKGLYFSPDNTYDIGKVADNRPKDVYVAGKMVVSGTLSSQGSGTSSFTSGLLKVGTGTPSTLDSGAGDLYVTDDLEIDGNLYSGGNLQISAVGNTGLGTTSPREKLEVDGNIYVSDDIYFGSGASLRNLLGV